jgi:hypothetical protein
MIVTIKSLSFVIEWQAEVNNRFILIENADYCIYLLLKTIHTLQWKNLGLRYICGYSSYLKDHQHHEIKPYCWAII